MTGSHADPPAADKGNGKSGTGLLRIRHALGAERDVVRGELGAADADEVARRRPVVREHVVGGVGRRIPSGSVGGEKDAAP